MSRRRQLRIALAAFLAASVIVGVTGDTTCVQAQSPSCRSACLADYNQCRLNTKGSPTCDSQYRTCLQSCVAPR